MQTHRHEHWPARMPAHTHACTCTRMHTNTHSVCPAGRSWIEPPKEKRGREADQCHIHTWSGHSKGVNAIRCARAASQNCTGRMPATCYQMPGSSSLPAEALGLLSGGAPCRRVTFVSYTTSNTCMSCGTPLHTVCCSPAACQSLLVSDLCGARSPAALPPLSPLSPTLHTCIAIYLPACLPACRSFFPQTGHLLLSAGLDGQVSDAAAGGGPQLGNRLPLLSRVVLLTSI